MNAATFSGNTPLHVAAGRRLKEIVALLMAYGANPAIANGEGDFPSDLPASLLVSVTRHGCILKPRVYNICGHTQRGIHVYFVCYNLLITNCVCALAVFKVVFCSL